MEIVDILQELERRSGKFPDAAVQAAAERRKEITPGLLRILEDTIARAAEVADDERYMAHLYAMFLLAQFREDRAYPLVIRYASLPDDVLDSLGGDFVTESLGRVLASVCGGDLAGIKSLIENEEVFEWARAGAVHSLVTLVAAGEKSREEIIGYFGSLFRGKLPRVHSPVWDALVGAVADLFPEELLPEIKLAYKDGLIDSGFVDLNDLTREMAKGKDAVLAELARNSHHLLVTDTVAEMEWWVCFREQERAEAIPTIPPVSSIPQRPPRPAAPEVEPEKAVPLPPIQRRTPKTGRNEPCPCGSGKKYKKCCGA